MSSVSHMSSDIKQKTEMSRSKSRERKLSFDKALGFDMTTLKESLALAEMKAAAASREIVKNIDIKNKLRKLSNGSENNNYVPPKQLLLYLVRMGSFTSKPKLPAVEQPDLDLTFPPCTPAQLLTRCKQELGELPAPFTRQWQQKAPPGGGSVRVLQWNLLSQTLGTKGDNFVSCPSEALSWAVRRWRILEELVRHQPDIICLQEVDHFHTLERALGSIGYTGKFVPKPDSPCIYMEGNSGPDGCAIFYRGDKFRPVSWHSRVLQVWRVESNQVVMAARLRSIHTNQELCVVTTHLKARRGALLSTLRAEQGADILQWLSSSLPPASEMPLILTGDLNAPPSEPVLPLLTGSAVTPLRSSYASDQGESWTTWKIRDTGEEKHCLDYVLHSPRLETQRLLTMPEAGQLGPGRLPSLQFPSDHMSLVVDLNIL